MTQLADVSNHYAANHNFINNNVKAQHDKNSRVYTNTPYLFEV